MQKQVVDPLGPPVDQPGRPGRETVRDDDGVVEDARRVFVERRRVKPQARPEPDLLDRRRFLGGLEVERALQWRAVLDVARRRDGDVLLGQGERVGGPLEVEGHEVGGGDAGEAAEQRLCFIRFAPSFVVGGLRFFAAIVFLQVRVDAADGEVVGKGRVAVGGDAGVLSRSFL